MMNRINRRDEIGGADFEKLFNCAVHTRVPNDYFSLHRAVTLGQPVDGHCELGKAIESLAERLCGRGVNDKKKRDHDRFESGAFGGLVNVSYVSEP